MWSPGHNFAFKMNGIDFIQYIYATKLSNVQHDLHGCHGPACLVQTFFVEPLPSDMMIWICLINDHIDYNSMSDSYYCNVSVDAWYLVLKVNELFYFLNQSFRQCLLCVNVKGVNTLM